MILKSYPRAFTQGLALASFLLCACVALKASANGSNPPASDPEVVTELSLERYAGTWEEIAHSPNFFQRKCLRSTAEYKVLSSSKVSVHNVCYKRDGSTSDISGFATIPDAKVPAKLRVRFNFFARGDYWVTHLDPNYEWAVVSGPKKKSIFLLSRTFPMEPQLLATIVAKLKAEGFDVGKLVYDVEIPH